MQEIINKIKETENIEKEIKRLNEIKIKYMTNDEMKSLRNKIINKENITTNELMRYSKSFSLDEKILDLRLKNINLKEDIEENLKKIKNFYKKYIINDERNDLVD